MKERMCEFEPRLDKKLPAEKQDAEIAAHAAQCRDCQESLKLAGWMHNFAAVSKPPSLPKSGFIRWRAQIVERQSKAKRATRPITWAQTAGIILVTAVVVWMLATNQNQFAPTVNALSASLSLVAPPLLIVLIGALFVWLPLAFKRRAGSKK